MRRATQALLLSVLAGTMTLVGTLVGAGPARLGVPASAGGDGGDDVSIVNLQFDPKELTVEVGTEVTWTNKDTGQVHSVTADDGSFDSSPNCSDANPGACLDSRDQFSHVFSAEGRFPYYSRTNGAPGGQGTSGVVVVVAAGTPTPTTTTATTSPPA